MKKLIKILIFTLTFTSCGLYQTTEKNYEIFNSNGSKKSSGIIIHKKLKKSDVFNYYQSWYQEYVEYYSSGKLKSKTISYYKISSYGRVCQEILFHFVSYQENGEKKYEIIDHCDCKKSEEKFYDKNGKLIQKRKYKVKMM